MNTFTTIFLIALLVTTATRLWLARRQARYVAARRDQVPAPFHDKIDPQSHRRAADYTVAQTRFGQVESAFDAALLVAWTLGGGLAAVDYLWRTLALSQLATGVGVVVTVLLIMGLLELPFSAYRTFVIEERFGFNKTKPSLFVTDALKQAALALVLGVPLAAAVLWLMEQAGQWWWLYAWAVWMAFTLILTWAYPRLIAPWFNTFNPLQDQDLKQRIQRLLSRCGFATNGIFVMDGSKRSTHGNAYFTGLGENKRIVFFDTLIDSLEPQEIEAVLAHELGHFKHKHIRNHLVLTGMLSLVGFAVLAWLMQQPWFYAGLGVSTPSTYIALLLFLMVAPVFTYFLQPAMSALSRRHEFEADDFAAEQADAGDLANALAKLYDENATTLTPDPVYSGFYHSHPPALARINNLTHQGHEAVREATS